ncbi:MAG: primosomal protein N' [Spirochaetaceae bacterium]|nr:MAG: primosomal protein N' [Spirochaetaceae bacterium]
MTSYVSIAFNVPLPALTYIAPAGEPCPVGTRVVASLGRRSLAGYVVENPERPPLGVGPLKTITRVIDGGPVFGPDYLELAAWLSERYDCSLGESLAAMIPGGRRESPIPELPIADEVPAEEPELSPEQKNAVAALIAAGSGLFYLHGVTGSGKTEVFLRAARATIESGRGVIYLVPEIALTHQLVAAISIRFAGETAVLHSRLTPSQRLGEWRRIIAGEARFVIGARSAVFAPIADLGLVVIDEEHEGSYKSGSTPRYHARQVAMKRCAEQNAALVMGSATPSVEAWHLMNTGRLTRLDLPHRVSGGSMPAIEVVDIRNESSPISRRLSDEIRATHAAGRQTILFLNRRGFAYFFHCRSCGYEHRCTRCSVALTYHKNRDTLVCHYCGYTTRPIAVCPECGSLDVGYGGFGTERIEEDVARLFPELTVARLDTDAVKKKGVLERTITAFRDHEIDILLGTQMVAKGLNFPGVRLVGIVLADSGLTLPDFRSAERTFSLIVQVAGRAGRFAPDGRVIVQTMRPEHPAIKRAVAGDLEGFYREELAVREQLGFPPFSRLMRVVARGRNREEVEAAADEYAKAVARALGADADDGGSEILGPAECPIANIAGNFRYHVIVKTRFFRRAHRAVTAAVRDGRKNRGVYLELDIDPVSLL